MEEPMDCFKLGEMRTVGDPPCEYDICSVANLRERLTDYALGPPLMLYFVDPTGDDLTIGIGNLMACVLYTQASGDPPYLMARGDSDAWREYMEFLCGDTPTPIRLALCMPAEKAIAIAVHFFVHRRIPDNIEWVET
jgi:hypothetical protein